MNSVGMLSSRITSQSLSNSDHRDPTEEQGVSRLDQPAADLASVWARSKTKRLFDIICVLLSAPIILPICFGVGLAVRLTSRGPALFKQRRTGLHGATFTIFKFRTMEHQVVHKAESTLNNQSFTPIGPFLRRWKLDELPQLLNVLIGDMSLVGPRPKMPEHQLGVLRCRPGITGAATLVFANEEAFLASIPRHSFAEYIHATVLPAKLRLDREYMADSTFASDLKLIVCTLIRRWDGETIYELLDIDHAGSASSRMESAHRATLDFAAEEGTSGD